jgi:hypothetical protein
MGVESAPHEPWLPRLCGCDDAGGETREELRRNRDLENIDGQTHRGGEVTREGNSMTLSDFAAIGSLVSGVAVLVSLV